MYVLIGGHTLGWETMGLKKNSVVCMHSPTLLFLPRVFDVDCDCSELSRARFMHCHCPVTAIRRQTYAWLTGIHATLDYRHLSQLILSRSAFPSLRSCCLC